MATGNRRMRCTLSLAGGLIFGSLLVVPFSSPAETIDLVCTDRDGFSHNYEVDLSQRTVFSRGQLARRVLIDKNEISFVLDLADREWFHSINRTTGSMTVTVRDADKSVLPSFKCEKAKPKF